MSQYYVIKSKLTGFVLTADGGGYQPSSKVTPQEQNGQDNQVFYDDHSTGTIRIKTSNFCLDIEDEKLVVRPFQHGDPNQQWTRADPQIRNKVDSNRVIDIYGENKDRGATVGAYKFNGNTNQCWTFEYVGGAAPAGGAPAAFPSQYPAYPGYPSAAAGGGYPAAGGYPSQVPQQPQNVPKREFYIVSEMNGKCLDIAGEDKKSGAKVIMYEKKKKVEKNQLWYNDNQGYIRSALNDFALFNTESGQPITMQPYADSPRFQWKFNGKKVTNKLGEVLDISRENDEDGAEVISYKDKKGKNQEWHPEYTS